LDRGRGNLPQPDSGVTDSAIGTADYPERVLARIEEASLPSQWFAALHLLVGSSDHRMPMSRLARDLSMTSGGFTKLADRMGQEGLIDRRNSSGDRRVVYAALTEAGLRLARRTERQYKAALREHVLDVLTAARLAALAAGARIGRHACRRRRGCAPPCTGAAARPCPVGAAGSRGTADW
jgi:DNA-binding MarR family transcriptional regulator